MIAAKQNANGLHHADGSGKGKQGAEWNERHIYGDAPAAAGFDAVIGSLPSLASTYSAMLPTL